METLKSVFATIKEIVTEAIVALNNAAMPTMAIVLPMVLVCSALGTAPALVVVLANVMLVTNICFCMVQTYRALPYLLPRVTLPF